MIDDLEPLLKDLAEPALPTSMTATVMARIARDVERREAAAAAPARDRRDRPAWLWAFVGVAVVLMAAMNGWFSSGALPDFISARIGLGRPNLMPVQGPYVMLLALGLLVYLAGLFAPLGTRTRD